MISTLTMPVVIITTFLAGAATGAIMQANRASGYMSEGLLARVPWRSVFSVGTTVIAIVLVVAGIQLSAPLMIIAGLVMEASSLAVHGIRRQRHRPTLNDLLRDPEREA